MDCLKIAKENPNKNVVLLGVGFETTTPTIGATILCADREKINNFSVICMHKVVPPALDVIINNRENKIDGFILPGHVAVLTGRAYFDFISKKGGKGVVTGFDAINIIESICKLVLMVFNKENNIVNNYGSVVSEHGNTKAQNIVKDVFEVCDTDWRGIGVIEKSGLKISDRYSKLDAEKKFEIKNVCVNDTKGCLCGQVLMGIKTPTDCSHYSVRCNPSNPIGPCMVSSEGTCAAYYKYIQD